MTEVYNLLQSSKPVTINLTQRPEVSDHDFIEEQEKYLYAIGTRTMALPIGRLVGARPLTALWLRIAAVLFDIYWLIEFR